MAKKVTIPPQPWWRLLLTCVLVALAVVSLLAGITTRYLRDNVIDTNGYLRVVGPLPKDPKVADALSTFTTQRVFDAAKAEENIKEALPPRLAPLASPLASGLQARVKDLAHQFVASDNFTTIWISSNRVTHDAIIRVAESEPNEERLKRVSSLDLGRLSGAVRERFGDKTLLSDEQKDKAATVAVNLHQNVQDLRTTVRVIRGSAHALPYLSVALLLGAIAIAYNRQRTVLGIGLLLALLAASMVIATKLFVGTALDDISEPLYREAAEVVYQAFYSDLHRRIIGLLLLGVALVCWALVTGPYNWARSLRRGLKVGQLKKMTPYLWAVSFRYFVSGYEWWADGAAAVVALIVLMTSSSLKPSHVVVVLSLVACFAAIIHMVAWPAPAKRAKA